MDAGDDGRDARERLKLNGAENMSPEDAVVQRKSIVCGRVMWKWQGAVAA